MHRRHGPRGAATHGHVRLMPACSGKTTPRRSSGWSSPLLGPMNSRSWAQQKGQHKGVVTEAAWAATHKSPVCHAHGAGIMPEIQHPNPCVRSFIQESVGPSRAADSPGLCVHWASCSQREGASHHARENQCLCASVPVPGSRVADACKRCAGGMLSKVAAPAAAPVARRSKATTWRRHSMPFVSNQTGARPDWPH